jgi:hypothetical protein
MDGECPGGRHGVGCRSYGVFARRRSAADDLGDPLVAHLQDVRNVSHRQSVPVRAPDRVVALRPELLGQTFQCLLLLEVIGGESREPAVCFRSFPLRSSDPEILGRISAI